MITSRRNAVFAVLTQALTFLKNVVLMSVVGVYSHALCFVASWLSGSALVSINEVTLRRVRLVLGWVTVCGRVNLLGL